MSTWPSETYASHALARWAWRAHEFLVALLLVELQPAGGAKSLRVVGVYGALDNLARLLLAPSAGAYVDRAGRFQGAALLLLLQNASILASSCAAAIALSSSSSSSADPSPALIALVVAGGALSGVGSAGAALGVEREWPVAVAAASASTTAQPSPLLSQINARMRAIDLACQLLAPAAAGLLMSLLGARAAALASAAFCALAWPPQVLLLRSAVRRSAALAKPKSSGEEGNININTTTTATTIASSSSSSTSTSAVAAYLRQPPLAPAFALALLYCTVLSLGMMMTAFLKTQGLPEASIAAGRGAGAFSGVGAALLFPSLVARFERKAGNSSSSSKTANNSTNSVAAAGLAGVLWQLGWLLLGAAPMVAADLVVAGSSSTTATTNRPRLWLLVAGLVASRAGLWTYDLATTQLQQVLVPQADQAKVGGVQAALQSGFELLSFVLAALLFPRPAQFPALIALSLAVVAAAAALYAGWWWSGGWRSEQEREAVREAAGVELAGRGEEEKDDGEGVEALIGAGRRRSAEAD